jgi:hypothetical protein
VRVLCSEGGHILSEQQSAAVQARCVLDNERAEALLVGLAQIRALEHIVLVLRVVSHNVSGGCHRMLSQLSVAEVILNHCGSGELGHLRGGEGLPLGSGVGGTRDEPGI